MMIEQHYDEEVLAGFLSEPIDQTSRDRHLAGCTLCKRTLQSIRDTAGMLKDAEVWERPSFATAPRPETLTFLRAVQQAMSDEDAAADVYVKHLLAGPRETWAAKLASHPEWRTAGTVRKLIAATETYNFSAPLDAVELTRILAEIAQSLPTTVVNRAALVSDAWREHAYAQMMVGSYSEAKVAVTASEEFARDASDFDQARTKLMLALLLRAQENWSAAAPLAEQAAAVFGGYGDAQKDVAARLTQAAVLHDSCRYREAADVYTGLVPFHASMPETMLVIALANEAACLRELGQLDRATERFVSVIAMCDRLQLFLVRAKAQWHLARVFMRQFRYEEALRVLAPLSVEFEELGMSDDVACVSVDTAECLLAVGRLSEVAMLCRQAIAYFEKAGLAYATGAMTALAYLQEAAANENLTPAKVAEVRHFVECLPSRPTAVFVAQFG